MNTIADYTDVELQAIELKIINENRMGAITDFNGEIKLSVIGSYFDCDKENSKLIRESLKELNPKWVVVYNGYKEFYQLIDKIVLNGSIHNLAMIYDGISAKMGRVIVENLNKVSK